MVLEVAGSFSGISTPLMGGEGVFKTLQGVSENFNVFHIKSASEHQEVSDRLQGASGGICSLSDTVVKR